MFWKGHLWGKGRGLGMERGGDDGLPAGLVKGGWWSCGVGKHITVCDIVQLHKSIVLNEII